LRVDNEPQLIRGYSSTSRETSGTSGTGYDLIVTPTIYHCRSKGACPGGELGTCARGRLAVACGRCKPRTYEQLMPEEEEDYCEPCVAGDVLPFIIAMFAFFGAVVCLHLLANRPTYKLRLSELYIVSIATIILSAVQDIMIFSSISIAWNSPVKEIMHYMTLLALNFEVLRFGCIAEMSKVMNFTIRVFVIPFVLLFLAVAHVVVKAWQKHKNAKLTAFIKEGSAQEGNARRRRSMEGSHRHFTGQQLRNSVGLLFMSFFISIAFVAMTPFRCYPHPSATAKMSLVAYPSVLCGEGDHVTMLFIAIAGTLAFPCTFMTYATSLGLGCAGFTAGRGPP
jgi:lysylphosphatidylglycerol synthetase-like protein (DUF2156 family)